MADYVLATSRLTLADKGVIKCPVSDVSYIDRRDLQDERSSARDRAESADMQVIETTNQPHAGWVPRDHSLAEAVELGLGLGAKLIHLVEGRKQMGQLENAGVCFYHQGRLRSHQSDGHPSLAKGETA